MATPAHIDIDSLLQPISEDAPCGMDVRDDPSPSSRYQIIKSERGMARAAERKSVHDGESSEAADHWRKIADIAPLIIREQSKDLEVATWYCEAMIRRYGFTGLRDSFALIHQLIENFWDHIYPIPDEYGLETRVSCLAGLSGSNAEGVLIAPIRKVPITGSEPAFSLWEYLQALEAQKTQDESARKTKIQKLGFSLEDIERSVQDSSTQFFIDLRDDIQQCIDTYRITGKKLDELCGLEVSPPTSSIIEVLCECLGAVNHIAKTKLPVIEEQSEATATDAENNTSTATTQAAPMQKGPIASREDAFKQLLEIAEYFRKTEPHSPVSYVIQKAVKWGNMPLGELVSELIIDDSARKQFNQLTGVESPEKN